MWHLVLSEIKYSQTRMIWIFSLTLPLLVFIQIRYENVSSFWAAWLIFVVCQNWQTMHNKDRRAFRTNLLPLKS